MRLKITKPYPNYRSFFHLSPYLLLSSFSFSPSMTFLPLPTYVYSSILFCTWPWKQQNKKKAEHINFYVRKAHNTGFCVRKNGKQNKNKQSEFSCFFHKSLYCFSLSERILFVCLLGAKFMSELFFIYVFDFAVWKYIWSCLWFLYINTVWCFFLFSALLLLIW